MNPVAMTIVNPWKEYWSRRGSNQRLPVLTSETLPTELWGSALTSKPKTNDPDVLDLTEDHFLLCFTVKIEEEKKDMDTTAPVEWETVDEIGTVDEVGGGGPVLAEK